MYGIQKSQTCKKSGRTPDSAASSIALIRKNRSEKEKTAIKRQQRIIYQKRQRERDAWPHMQVASPFLCPEASASLVIPSETRNPVY
jgi:hypothetical protein